MYFNVFGVQKCKTLFRMDMETGSFHVGGQKDEKYGELDMNSTVRKELIVSADWMRCPTTTITVKEYRLFDTSGITPNIKIIKRKLLCKSTYFFYLDSDEDYLQKCQLTVRDSNGTLLCRKVFSQIDMVNRKFFTNQ